MNNIHDPITQMINNKGNWKTLFMYNNYGKNFMFLLPKFINNNDVRSFTKSLIHMVDEYDYEGPEIVCNYMKLYPETPFIVQAESITECIDIMNDKLTKVDFNDNTLEVYNTELERYYKFLKLCENLSDSLSKTLIVSASNDTAFLKCLIERE